MSRRVPKLAPVPPFCATTCELRNVKVRQHLGCQGVDFIIRLLVYKICLHQLAPYYTLCRRSRQCRQFQLHVAVCGLPELGDLVTLRPMPWPLKCRFGPGSFSAVGPPSWNSLSSELKKWSLTDNSPHTERRHFI